MTFKEYTYKRPEIDEVKHVFSVALNRFKGAKDVSEQIEAIRRNKHLKKFSEYDD